MAVTGKDIARELGISQPTVSRILNGNEDSRVSAATRDRVFEAAQRLGYRPNAIARSLKHGRTHCVGFYSIYDYDARNDFMSSILGGLQRACTAHRLSLMLLPALPDQSAEEIALSMRDGRIDGLFLHAAPGDPLVAQLCNAQLPVVAMADLIEGVPSVAFDNLAGTTMLVEMLRSRGYRRFVYAAPRVELQSVEARVAAFEVALRDDETGRIERLDYEMAEPLPGILADWLADGEPFAVCCWNDRTAYRLIAECWRHDIQVPGQMAIVGFDGFLDLKLPLRQLVTVGGDWDELARRAFDVMSALIEGEKPSNIVLPVHLFPGDTV